MWAVVICLQVKQETNPIITESEEKKNHNTYTEFATIRLDFYFSRGKRTIFRQKALPCCTCHPQTRASMHEVTQSFNFNINVSRVIFLSCTSIMQFYLFKGVFLTEKRQCTDLKFKQPNRRPNTQQGCA